MTVQTEITQGDAPIANGLNGDGDNESIDKMPNDNQIAYETYKKALVQRHKLKEENNDLKTQVELSKQRELEAEGKLKEKAHYWKEKAIKAENDLETKSANWGWSQVQSQLSAELLKAGCINPKVAIGLINKEELKSVEVDSDYTVSKADLDRLIDSLKRDKELSDIRLFKEPKGVNDMAPTANAKKNNEPKSLKTASDDDLMAKWKENI